jgi:hypothetical protein
MTAEIRLLKHVIAGHGSRQREYHAGDVVLAGLTEAMEWCLRGWAKPADAKEDAAANNSGEQADEAPPVPFHGGALVECFRCVPLAYSASAH